MLNRLLAASAVAALMTGPAFAVTSGDVLRGSLYHGTLALGTELLTAKAAEGDPEAAFGIGLLGFVTAIEHMSQGLYRYGIAAPDTRQLGVMVGGPIPANPNPEHLDYEAFRQLFVTFVDEMDAASKQLGSSATAGDYVVKLDPMKFRLDINGDGHSEEGESLAGLIAQVSGSPPPYDVFAPHKLKVVPNKDGTIPVEEAGIGFDQADAIWLAGYSDVLAGEGDLILAHDFSDLFNAVLHRLFPRAGLPMQDFVTGGSLMMDPATDSGIADLIAAVHTMDWPVVEPDRLKRVLTRAHEVTNYSRRNWAAILAETDDDMELLPSPTQTPTFQGPDGKITQEMVDAWLATLDKVDEVLDGKLLLPHWRFKQGFDLKAYFETATETDLVMLLTGYGALPYLKDGPIADMDTFAEANRIFGGNLWGYAFWFN